jgi:hypothetical protein
MGSDVTFLDISPDVLRMPIHITSGGSSYWCYVPIFDCKLLAKFISTILFIDPVISNTVGYLLPPGDYITGYRETKNVSIPMIAATIIDRY